MNIKEFLNNNKEVAQIIYGTALVILIPLLIVLNTVFIIKKYNQSLDLSLQRQALSVGRAISVLMENDLPWVDFIQFKIDLLMAGGIGLEEICVLKPADNEFTVIASSNEEKIGTALTSYYYEQAWSQAGDSGLATDSLKLAEQTATGTDAAGRPADGRFWLVAMPMNDGSGAKQALLTIKLSSKIVDDLTEYNRNFSVYLLIGTVFIVILFLLAAVRMWDYVFLYRRVKAVDRMKDEFIAMASHELRSPVAGIRGYISMILDGTFGPVNQKTGDCLKTVQGAAGRLTGLVEDLLDVSRIEQGRLKLNLKAQDPMPLVGNAVAEMAGQAEEKKLALNYTTPAGELPFIKVDALYLRQILVNLLSNAIKYTQAGSVELSVEKKQNGKALEIRIKDTGIGMSKNERARLFEKFYRVKNEKTGRIPGTGLGLYIVKQLIEMMDGRITIESVEDVGTLVKLRFPAAFAEK